MNKDCSHDCKNCASDCGERTAPQKENPNAHSHIKKVIGVVSGKGGVGKSLVTSLLACAMNQKGFQVAVLDADITGPSIPQIFGIHEKVFGVNEGVIPAQTAKGVKLMSINLLLEHDTDPVVWRGPIIANVVRQFWTDVVWGDLDCMFVDMPPGTGDVPLTVFQSLPVDGLVVVTSPQELVSMIVSKAVKMAALSNIPVLGIVENMSYFECPNCHEQHKIFGESHVDQLASDYGIQAVAKIPIAPNFAACCDSGKIESISGSWLAPVLEAIASIAEKQ